MIYFAFSPSRKEVKIGYTDGPIKKRLTNLQTAAPDIYIIAKAFGGLDEEKYLHRRFGHLNVSREWFRYEKEIAKFIEDLNSNQKIPLWLEAEVSYEKTRQSFMPKSWVLLLQEILASPDQYFITEKEKEFLDGMKAKFLDPWLGDSGSPGVIYAPSAKQKQWVRDISQRKYAQPRTPRIEECPVIKPNPGSEQSQFRGEGFEG